MSSGQNVFIARLSPSLHWVASGKAFARIVIAEKKAPSCALETSSSSLRPPLAKIQENGTSNLITTN